MFIYWLFCNIAEVIATANKNSGGLSRPVRFRGTAIPTQHTETLSPPSSHTVKARLYCGRLALCPRCVENWQFSESSTIALNAMRS